MKIVPLSRVCLALSILFFVPGLASPCWSQTAGRNAKIAALVGPLKSIKKYATKLSPDGRCLVFGTESTGDDKSISGYYTASGVPCNRYDRTVLWAQFLDPEGQSKGDVRCLTPGWGTSWNPAWSPDGEKLAFFSDKSGKAELYVWDRSTGRTMGFGQAIVRNFEAHIAPQWSPDSMRVFFQALPSGTHSPLDQAQTLVTSRPRADSGAHIVELLVNGSGQGPSADASELALPALDANWMSYVLEPRDLAMADLKTGHVTRLRHSQGVMGIAVSPDGRYVADLEYQRPQGINELGDLYNLYLTPIPRTETSRPPHDIRAQAQRPVAQDIPQNFGSESLYWSPDSTKLAYVTSGTTAHGDVYIVDLAGGGPHNLTQGFRPPDASQTSLSDPDKDQAHSAQVKFWNYPAPTWTKDSTALICASAQGGFRMIPVRGGPPEKCDAPASKPGVEVIEKEGPTQPPDLWTIDTALANPVPHRVTHINPQLANVYLPKPQVIEWTTASGQPNKGLLFLPPMASPGHKAPLIVFQYPGEEFSTKVDSWLQYYSCPFLFTTLGYAVLFPDDRLYSNNPSQEIADNVLPCIDAAVATGAVDGNNVGCMGQSFGGYGVASLITHSTRFKAAVDIDGVSDYITDYLSLGSFEWAENGQGRTGGTLWEQKDRYIQNSPVLYLDKVQTPLLLIDGSNDFLLSQGQEMYNGLVRLGKAATLAVYPGCGHSWLDWSGPQQIDFWQRVFGWFDSHLKNDTHVSDQSRSLANAATDSRIGGRD